MLKDSGVSISCLNEEELKAAIEKQNYLIKSFGSKLPDRGARLKVYIEKLKLELSNRSEGPRLPPQCSPTTPGGLVTKPRGEPPRVPNTSSLDRVNQSRTKNGDSDRFSNEAELNVTALSEQLSSLVIENVSDKHVSDSDDKSEEDLSSVPVISLNEVLRLRHLLNLPALILSHIRWFLFTLRPIGDLVYLVVIDCANPDRQLVRIGLLTTWFPATHPRITAASTVAQTEATNRPSSVSQSAEALRDFWQFISTSPKSIDDPVPDASVPCLVCRSAPNQGDRNSVNDLIWFSRLLRNTRHFTMARAGMPRDCRFIDTRSLNLEISSRLSFSTLDQNDSKSNQLATDQIIQDLQALRKSLFHTDNGESFDCNALTFRQYNSAHEFLNAAVTRSLPWMEASLELEFLRELKASNTLSEHFQRSVRFTPTLSSSSSNGSTPNGLQSVPDRILRRLASLGLGRTRLTRLAGLSGWRGFAGLLAYRFQCSANNSATEGLDENRATAVFVTDDLKTLQDLYTFFHHIHSHMHRHKLYYQEGKKKQDVAGPRVPLIVSTPSTPNAPVKVRAWVASGNELFDPNAQRNPRVLSMEESIELMKRAQKAYQEARMRRDVPTYPSLPPDSEKLYRYRDIHRDFERDTESSDEDQSSVTEDSGSQASSDSDTSLGLEDVD